MRITIRQSSFGPDGYSGVHKTTRMTEPQGQVISTNSVVRYSIMNPVDDRRFPVFETVERAIYLTEQLLHFWKNAEGWAPQEAADLLTRSRLDRQSSITKQLRLFTDAGNQESGYLILGWATLGSLTEGLLKLFLAVHFKTYKVHTLTDDIAKIVKDRKGNIGEPDGLMLEKLRQFFEKKVFPENAAEVWASSGEMNWSKWLEMVQSRRNAIHAFKDREIATIAEFHQELSNYLIFLRKIAQSLPYPDEVYEPRESQTDGVSSEVGVKIDDRWYRGAIKNGKLMVRSQSDGDYLKATLNLNEEVMVVNPGMFPDWND